jgi:hypothetical protein
MPNLPSRKKVFLASGTPEKFAFLEKRFGDAFKLTDDSSEADLIIVDLASPVLSWVTEKAEFVGSCCPPFVLTALDGPENQVTLTVIKDIFKGRAIGQVYKQPQEVEETLAWMQSIFPFFNKRNVPTNTELERSRTDMVLQGLR